ncbi:MAG: DNA repair exonuclease [Clostridia bacterium]|nr:DNA repair exonuclease [Clostridia bacterium]
MNSVKILHTADLHIGSGRINVKGGKAEIENTFLRIINTCKSQNVDFLLIAGDLFDTPFVSADVASKIISAMSQIPDTIIVISPGNHDCACPGSVYLKYEFPENVIIFNSFLKYQDFPQKNVRLWGAGFTDRFESLPLLQSNIENSTDRINICVLHGELVAENSSGTYNPIHPSTIEKSGFDYMALGHIHKRSDIEKLGKTHFSYSGCPDGMGFDETGSLGVYIGTVSKESANLEFLEMSSREYIIDNVDITLCKNTFDISDKILSRVKQHYSEKFTENLYRITLTGTVPADVSLSIAQLESVLGDTLYYAEVIDKSDTDVTHIEKLATETSLRGIFVRKMLDKLKSASLEEQLLYKNALKIGLQSFSKGVTLDDN